MRRLSLLLPVLPLLLPFFLLAACRGTKPYSAEDLAQVRESYAEIVPIYKAYKAAFYFGTSAQIEYQFRREQGACKLVDVVDKRDTIDPNTNLFAASAGLDSLCNDIESSYVLWAKSHHLPYEKHIVPQRPDDAFLDGDTFLKKMPNELRHPAAYY